MLHELFSGDVVWFSAPAALGSGLFILRLALLLLGHDGHGHGSIGDPGDHGGMAFEILSLQGLAALIMGFGWSGLAALVAAKLTLPASMGVGVAGGFLFVWLVGALLANVRNLESTGNMPPEAFVGVEGTVYSNVPVRGGGFGQVTVVNGTVQRTFNAVSTGPELNTRTRVRVLAANEDNTVTVEPVEA